MRVLFSALALTWTLSIVPPTNHAHWADTDYYAFQLCGTGTSVITGTITVYPIWYNSAANPWTNAQKQYVRAWITGFDTSPLGYSLHNWPNNSGNATRHFVLGAECVDAESQGTSIAIGGSVALHDITPNGCLLPEDTNGIYVVFPSDTDVLSSNAHGIQTLADSAVVAVVGIDRRTPCSSGQPCPSGFVGQGGFDGMLRIGAEELAEATTDRDVVNGWRCSGSGCVAAGGGSTCLGGLELVDVCDYTPAGGRLQASPINGNGYNYATTYNGVAYYFDQPPIWNGAPSNQCNEYALKRGAALTGTVCTKPQDCMAGAPAVYPANMGFDSLFWNPCVYGQCQVPRCNDSASNADETDVDCGGGTCGAAPPSPTTHLCASGKLCWLNSDCSSNVCNTTPPSPPFGAGRCQ